MEFIQIFLFLSTSISDVHYDEENNTWLFDPQMIVSRNNVLYYTPSLEPYEAMPTGGGDLSAMVRCDGGIHLHLSKSDSWGYQSPADAPLGTRYFNNVSPGHVYINFGKSAENEAQKFFRQCLDLYHGKIVINLGSEDNGAIFEIWGHPYRKIIIVEISDPNNILSPPIIELSEWRETMEVGFSASMIHAKEINKRPASPNLANTGMQNYFNSENDPMLGRGTAVVIASPSIYPEKCYVDGKSVYMKLTKNSEKYYIVIASSVTKSGDPLDTAFTEINEAISIPLEDLKEEHHKWWSDYWSKSFLRICSPDKKADWLCSAYHVHLYTLACVNRGAYPAKWDGGAGLMRNDERTWGLSEWVQEIRFTYLPLYSANRLDMAKGLFNFYSNMIDYLKEQTLKMWAIHGLWIPETVLPWGHAEDFAIEGDKDSVQRHFHRWDPDNAPYGRFKWYNPYVGFLFTSGLEICKHYFTYYYYSGDEKFLHDQAYPIVKGVCEFISNLLRKEDDGLYHLDPANALETWWMVRDPADTFAGIRAIFPEFIKLSERYGYDIELRNKCIEILANIPEPSLGLWTEDGKIYPEVNVYAPAEKIGKIPNRNNSENPALYRIFPFGLSGIGSSDYEIACRTFDRRICSLGNGWSMDAIWSARLGLAEEACELITKHAERFNRFRYGGWDSNDSNVFPDGLSVVPFTDAGGLSAFALNEILLQSHNDIIRIIPAVSKDWSGIFRLRAEGGFLVASDFQEQIPKFIEIKSLLGKKCRLKNPWKVSVVVKEGKKIILQSDSEIIEFNTKPDFIYIIEPMNKQLCEYNLSIIEDLPNQSPGMPGRSW